MTDKIRDSIIHAAIQMVTDLRSTADRLERAVMRRDFSALAEISLSSTTWTLDAIRGAALVVVRSEP